MHARPRAKVNLTLSVGPRGRDGYHPLASTFLRVGLADELTVALAENDGRDVLTVSGMSGAEAGGNLVLAAFRAAREALGQSMPPIVAQLDKRIPIAAGLGGGSADAAAALNSALQLWGAGLAPQVVAGVALDLGADVPFFASSAVAAQVSGRGENVEALEVGANPGLLLVTPPIALSTAAVFARFDDLDAMPSRSAPPVVDFAHLADQSESLRDANDLWPAAVALAPALGDIRAELERLTNRPWLMSGSGSTLFAIYESAADAAAAGRAIVASESEVLGGALYNAVDVDNPDPAWRYQ